ncbi:YbaN family protein [Corynebacterium uterequi]|uniref:DUF454 family protein n=1 Tax=Corynebacterium uterequi TaxID=1072256 RepID=A0A0G3HJR5_9CORY|nr:YbaN family protein [Corynebacterium uterequi]AKK12163.1 hypothetical protein CUTER_11010 [Corynebacterium uterequi]
MLKPLLIVVGMLATGLGAVGVVLPVLPTTPFLLLAVFCFARSSTRFNDLLLRNRVLGPYITNYYNHSMSPRDKAGTLALMWCGILLSCVLIGKTVTWVILPLIAMGVTIHIVRLSPRPHAAPVPQHDAASSPGGANHPAGP